MLINYYERYMKKKKRKEKKEKKEEAINKIVYKVK